MIGTQRSAFTHRKEREDKKIGSAVKRIKELSVNPTEQ